MPNSILDFLLEAKRQTYASQGDDASVTPMLPGSRQLEYRNGSLFYRDIYFGVSYFVGQETVYQDESPIWSMSYSEGVEQSILAPNDVRCIYAFLRVALRQISSDNPFRGPDGYRDGMYAYGNAHKGKFDAFWGNETITRDNAIVYRLQYSDGLLR
ncbi:MAG: DUF5680 domain-containing protein [Bacilli bacterium]